MKLLRQTFLSRLALVVLLGLGSLTATATNAVIGTGTSTTNGSSVDPVDGFYNYIHYQTVYTAAELSAAGMTSGAIIDGVGFSISEVYTGGSLANFKIRMGHTTAADDAGYISTAGMTTVRAAASYSPTLQTAGNFDMLTLGTTFTWNGTDNIVVDVTNGSIPFASPYGGLRYTTKTNGARYIHCDGCGDQSSSATTAGTTSRPNIQFSYTAGSACSGTPTAGTAIASISTFQCPSSSTLSLSGATSATGLTYQWESSSDNTTFTTIGGATSSSYVASVAATTYYHCIVTCTGSSLSATSTSVQVSVTGPAPGNTVASSTNVCSGSTTALSLQNSVNAAGYQWQSSPDGTTYSNIAGATNATYTATITASTYYKCIVTCSTGGANATSTAVLVNLNSTFYNCYCVGTTTNGCASGDHITSVDVAGISNTSGACISGGSYSNYQSTVSPGAMTGANSYSVTVHVANGGTEYAGMWIDYNKNGTFDASEFTALTVVGGTGTPDYTYTGTVVVPSGVTAGATGLRVRSSYNAAVSSSTPCGTYSYGETEDYVVVLSAAPACSGFPTAPGNTISSTGALATSGTPFTLSLTNQQSTSGITYTWYVSTDGQATWNVVAGATSSSYTVTQSGNGTYDYYCDVTCTNSNKTSTSNAVTVATQIVYCVPVTTTGCTDGDVIARVILNTLDNTSGTGCPSAVVGGTNGGYSNYYDTTGTGFTTSLKPATTYGCTVYAGQYAEGYAAWIDYNNDGVFDNATERIGYSAGQVAGSGSVGVLGSSATFPITLSCTPPAGAHRMRVRCMYATNGVDVTPCTNNTYGEVEDYKITITAQANCAPGGALSATPGSDTAHLHWDAGCSTAPKWDFEYGAPGFVQGGGSGTVLVNKVASGDYTLTGLTANTSYDVYYRARCGAGTGPGTGNSTWSLLPLNFTTTMLQCSGTPGYDTVSGGGSVCSGANFTLTATGPTESVLSLSYSWEVSTNAGATWTAISGATNRTSVSTSTTVAAQYRQVTTCSNSGLTAVSNVVSVTINTNFFACYCTATNQGSALITQVQLRNQIRNTVGAQSVSPYYYTPVYTADTFQVRRGASVPFTVSIDGTGPAIVSVWVDYNHDGVYAESEWQQVTTSTNTSETIMLNVPDTAVLGLTGMRVRSRLSGNPNAATDACLAMGSGETEDYLVNVSKICTVAPGTPTPPAVDTTLKVCAGETRTYTLNWGATADSYTWTAPTGGTIVSGQNTGTVVVSYGAGFVATDTLRVVAVGHCGQSAQRKVVVYFRGAPATPGVATIDNTGAICPGESRIYTVANNPLATSYTWTGPTGGTVSAGQGTNSATVGYGAGFVASGVVSVVANNGCGTSAPRTANAAFRGAPGTPGPITMASTDKVCPGEARSFTIAAVTGANSYTWVTPAATINSGAGTVSITATFGASYTQDTAVKVSSVNTCGSSAQRTFLVKRRGVPKAPAAVIGNNYGVCSSASEAYSVAAVTGASSYNWSFNTADASVTSGQGTTAITAAYNGAFLTGVLSVGSQNGCGTSLLTKNLTVYAVPAKPVISGPLTACPHTTHTYSTVAGYGVATYTWSAQSGSVVTDGVLSGNPITTTHNSVDVTFGNVVGKVNCIANNTCGSTAKAFVTVVDCNASKGALEETAGAFNVELVPNPATDQVTVRLNASDDSKATVRILSMTGQQMISMEMESTLHSQLIIPVNQLAAGMYMVEVTTANGEKQVKQLVKQ